MRNILKANPKPALILGGLLTLSLAGSALLSSQAQNAITPMNEQRAFLEDEQNTIDIVSHYGPSVVAILVEAPAQAAGNFDEMLEQVPEQFREFFRQFPDSMPEGPVEGSGSGFLIDDEGHIVTNYHVVAEALAEGSVEMLEGASLTVTFPNTDDTELSVTVVGANPSFDLALLLIEDPEQIPSELSPIPLADSNQVVVGQKVIAIGNPFGFASTVTTGIVSGLNRDEIPTIGDYGNASFIQTDAAINPGNSGGPLFNSRGELIGINTAIIPNVSADGSRGNLGVGFAVPSNHLKDNLEALKAGGFKDIYSSRPRLGIGIMDARAFPEDVRESLQIPERGVVIRSVEEGSPADKAGLRGGSFTVKIGDVEVSAGGDVIIAIDDTPVTTSTQLQDLVFAHQPGDEVKITYLRKGQERTATIALEIVPQAAEEVEEE